MFYSLSYEHWCHEADLNCWPTDYDSATLPSELSWHMVCLMGFEPITSRLKVWYSTNWVTNTYLEHPVRLELTTEDYKTTILPLNYGCWYAVKESNLLHQIRILIFSPLNQRHIYKNKRIAHNATLFYLLITTLS